MQNIREFHSKNIRSYRAKNWNKIYQGSERLLMKMKFGNKIVDVDTSLGVPTIKARVEEVRHSDGRIDQIVHVPCLTIASKKN